MGIGFIWALIFGAGILFLSEYTRHHWNYDHPERARTTMAKFYGIMEHHPLIDSETEEIKKSRLASSGGHPWYEAITGPRMLYIVLRWPWLFKCFNNSQERTTFF